MWIILEGCDFSGKSTLAKSLETLCHKALPRRDVTMLHRSRPDPETRRTVLKDYVLSVESYRPDQKQVLISDRWHFGEATYAPLKRPHTNKDGFGLLGYAGWRWTELFLLSRGAVTVWLNQPLEVLIARSQRGDDYIKVNELATIVDLYHKAVAQSPSTKLILAPQPGIPLETTDVILAAGLQASFNVEQIAYYPQYIGPPQPAALLVGDRRNITKKYGHETKLTFMPVDGNSSEFLLTGLPDPLWRDLGMININDMYSDDFVDLVSILGSPQVIALGREAARGLQQAGLSDDDFVLMPHPQHVRRFRNEEKLAYGDAIGEAVTTGKVDPAWRLS
jgi:thymidylate kinase